MTAVEAAARPHGAKFSARHLEAIDEVLAAYAESVEAPEGDLDVLDPFAGVGRIHELPWRTVGVELEPEWADQHPDTIVGDATALPFPDDTFDAVATSPTYGNRMADTYDGSRDTCRRCRGDGCPVCAGSGFAPSQRNTYRINLGRELSPNNSGGMQWGSDYRRLHRLAWAEAVRVVRPGGLIVVNVSNHVRKGEVPPVVEWHLATLFRAGAMLVSAAPLDTRRWRVGANHEARVSAEHLLVVRVPS